VESPDRRDGSTGKGESRADRLPGSHRRLICRLPGNAHWSADRPRPPTALRCCDRPHRPEGETTLAREKNTSRANARRRTRASQRAEYLAATDPEAEELEASGTATVQTERKPMFKMPNIREDIRALPQMFRERRRLFVPVLMLLVGFALALAYPGLSVDIQSYAGAYIQFFFLPQSLFTYFLGGFFAPRAGYLIGFLLGVLDAVLWVIIIVMGVSGVTAAPGQSLQLESTALVLVSAVLTGTIAGALASWYRDFLRGIQERGQNRRAERENAERDKRRLERQEARRVAKQRPTS
jgi:hypothetical protein